MKKKKFFIFKQKTAYEIKECDWSSDVCSSDLMIPIEKDAFLEAIFRTNHKWCGEGILKNKNVYFLNRTPYNHRLKRTKNKKCLISFMGVGEPLLNLKLIKEIFRNEKIIKESCNYNEVIYAISTMMPNKNLKEFSNWINVNNFPVKIHFSMHSPFSDERKTLLPKTDVNVREALEMMQE